MKLRSNESRIISIRIKRIRRSHEITLIDSIGNRVPMKHNIQNMDVYFLTSNVECRPMRNHNPLIQILGIMTQLILLFFQIYLVFLIDHDDISCLTLGVFRWSIGNILLICVIRISIQMDVVCKSIPFNLNQRGFRKKRCWDINVVEVISPEQMVICIVGKDSIDPDSEREIFLHVKLLLHCKHITGFSKCHGRCNVWTL